MRVEILNDNMGFNVRLASADRRDFAHLLSLFKSCVPDNCRRFNAGLWRVEKRAARSLETFIGMASDAGANVIQSTQPRAVVTLPGMISGETATASTYLTVSDESDGGDVLEYRARCRAGKRPAVIVTKHDRFASLRATVYGAALTDEAKRRCFDYLITGALPCGSVRVSNRELVCSRLSFHLAAEMAAWLNFQLGDSLNIIAGNLDGHEHARLEATKQADGRIKMAQGATRRAA